MQVVGKNTKEFIEILDFGFKVIDAYRLSMADGNFNIVTDGGNFITPAIALPAAFQGYQSIWKDFQKWTPADKQEVYDFVDARFPDLGDDVREELIQETIKEVIGDFELAAKWSFYTKKRPLPTPVRKQLPTTEKLKTVAVKKS
ncbi:MAG: hypothetical protein AAGI23_09465 [Bacteroidota bacterium]